MKIQVTFKKFGNFQEGVSKSGNAWKKQEFICETQGQYPKQIAFTAFNTTADNARTMMVNEDYDVEFDIESREFNGKWYTDIRAISITSAAVAQTQQQPQPQPKQQYQPQQEQPFGGPVDDLPF